MPPRIVILSNRDIRSPEGGGAPLYIHETMKRLIGKFDITIVSRGSPNLPAFETVDGIKIARVQWGHKMRFAVPVRYLSKLSQRTDLLIDNQDGAIPWMSPLFSHKAKVLIAHQFVREIFYTILSGFFAIPALSLEKAAYRCYRNTRIITISQSTKNDLCSAGIPSRNIKVVPPGIDRDFLSSTDEFRRHSNEPLIVCISRLEPYKGVAFLIKAMPIVRSRVKDVKAIIAGDGRCAKEMEELALKTGVADSVEFRYRQPHQWKDEKKKLLSRASVLVVPSIREGFGIVVLEANARGTPAIGWNVPGLKDSIVNERTGILVQPFDIKGLADAISRLLLDTELRVRLGSEGLSWAKEHSWDQAAQSIQEELMELTRK